MERIEFNVKTKEKRVIPLTQEEMDAIKLQEKAYQEMLKAQKKQVLLQELRENDIKAIRGLLNSGEPESIAMLKERRKEADRLRQELHKLDQGE